MASVTTGLLRDWLTNNLKVADGQKSTAAPTVDQSTAGDSQVNIITNSLTIQTSLVVSDRWPQNHAQPRICNARNNRVQALLGAVVQQLITVLSRLRDYVSTNILYVL